MKIKLIIISTMVALLLGCELVGANLFEKMDQYDYQVSGKMDTGDIKDVLNNTNPEDLPDSDVDTMTVVLQDKINDPNASTLDQEEAALVLVDLQLSANGGDDIVNNVPKILDNLDNTDLGSDPQSTQDLFGGLLGSPESPEDVALILKTMGTVQEAFTIFNDGSETLETLDDASLATLAQQAIVATAVDIVADIIVVDSIGLTQEEIDLKTAEVVYNLITAPVSVDPVTSEPVFVTDSGDQTLTELLGITDSSDLETQITDLSGVVDGTGTGTQYDYLGALINAAGLAL